MTRSVRAEFFARVLRFEETGVVLALIALTILFSSLSAEFMTLQTWGNILSFAVVIGVIALGATLLMIAGEYDLSVGSNTAVAGMIFAMGVETWQQNSYAMMALALAASTLLGFVNGLVTLTTRIPSFITTLGALFVWRGAVLAVSGGTPVSLSSARSGAMTWFGTNLGNGFYSAVLWWIGLAIVLSWVLKNTRFGNHMFATGGDADAARSMGVNTTRIKLLTFTLCGFLAGLAGVILFSVLPDLSPTSGESYELYAIAAAVIGGTALSGGSGTILGTLLGTLLMGVVQTGLVHAKVENYWFRTFVGLMLVLAVILNVRIKVWVERLSR